VIHARENITSQFAAEIVLAASTTALQKECAAPVLARFAWYFGQGLFMSPPCPPVYAITLAS
jgi:hypothetical protein